MPLLRIISKDDLLTLWCYIHPCLCLHLWRTLAWVNRALLLLYRESRQIVDLLAILPRMLLLIRACYVIVLAMSTFYAMSSWWWYAYLVLQWLVVSESSLLSSVHDVAVLLGWICYFAMLYKHVATNHSMHNIEMFTKDDLLYISCSSHPCPGLHLWPAVACSYLAPKLLDNVAVSLLTLSSLVPMCFASVPCILWPFSCHA